MRAVGSFNICWGLSQAALVTQAHLSHPGHVHQIHRLEKLDAPIYEHGRISNGCDIFEAEEQGIQVTATASITFYQPIDLELRVGGDCNKIDAIGMTSKVYLVDIDCLNLLAKRVPDLHGCICEVTIDARHP